MRKYNYIFFDMDGTFTNSRNFHSKAFYRFFNKYFNNVDMDTVDKGIGATIKSIFDSLKIPEERNDELYNKLGDFYKQEADDLIREIEVVKGAKEVFLHLKKQDYKIALITNSLQQLAERVLYIHGLCECFDLVVGADQHSLDKEERCIGAMQVLKAKPNQILYIGDAERDIEIANVLGYDSCFAYTDISWCEDYKYTVNVLRPTYIIKEFEKLSELIE